MSRNPRRGDRAGIAFLFALIGSAFVPSVLSEARLLLPPAAVAYLLAPAPRPAEAPRLVFTGVAKPRPVGEMELPSETSSSPEGGSVHLEPGVRISGPLAPPRSLLPRSAGPPRHHESRAPPPSPFPDPGAQGA